MRNSEQMRLDALVKELYRAGQIVEDRNFNWILEQVVKEFRCSSTAIITAHSVNHLPLISDHYAIDPKYVNSYNQYFNKLDPTLAVLRSRALQIVPDHVTERNVPSGNSKWNTFVEEFVRPQKHFYTAAINITSKLDGFERAWIWTRTKSQGAFTPGELSRLETIGFHLSDIYAQKELKKNNKTLISISPDDFLRRFNCTKRQAEIAHAVCTSTLTLDQIAQKFGIDVTCVKSHLTPVYQSSGLKRRGLTALMLGLPQ